MCRTNISPVWHMYRYLFFNIITAEFKMSQCCFLGQNIWELNMAAYNYGGVRMTGLQLVENQNETHRPFFDAWSRLDTVDWPGAGGDSVSVGISTIWCCENAFEANMLICRLWPDWRHDLMTLAIFVWGKTLAILSLSCFNQMPVLCGCFGVWGLVFLILLCFVYFP